jgi:probable F420-dependent oxidoreductase
MGLELGKVGIWMSSSIWRGNEDELAKRAREIELLGFRALWLGGVGSDLVAPEAALRATERLVVSTGIVNIWTSTAAALAASFKRLSGEFPNRLFIGIGAGHKARLEGTNITYRRPYSSMGQYLDILDASGTLPARDRALAALGPKMVALSGERAAGAHPFLVSPSHTADARSILGPAKLLAPEQGIVLEADPDEARSIARARIAKHLALTNYQNSFLRQGFTADDIANGGSDRFIDAIVGWGAADSIVHSIQAHLTAGADHVAVQVFTKERRIPGVEYQSLKDMLGNLD